MSAFSRPERCGTTYRQPAKCHLVAKATGGMKLLFHQITTDCVPDPPDNGSYTNISGCFDAGDGCCLLARRYRYLRVLGSGQSSVVIKAQDTFCGDKPIAIKILHSQYYHLGGQESDCFLKLQASDPFGFSPIAKLLNMFIFDDHYCMVFELLYSPNWTKLFHPSYQPSNTEAVFKKIRQVALCLFQVLGFLQTQNVIHADLKPDNLLLKNKDDPSSLRVADLGNAIQCIYNEVSLYYDDFELQTLIYRAPEVIFGLQFGCEIDMWSVGCILAEFFLGKPLFYGNSREGVLKKMVEILGLVPRSLVQRGKFYYDLEMFTSAGTQPDATSRLRTVLETGRVQKCTDYAFISFLSQLLRYDPAERLSHTDAACHVFMAREIGLGYILPSSPNNCDLTRQYPSILLTKNSYTHKPVIHKEISRQHPSSLDLLYMGTSASLSMDSTQTKGFSKGHMVKVLPLGFQNTAKPPHPDESTGIIQSTPVVNGGNVQNPESTTHKSQLSANRRTPNLDQSLEIIQPMSLVNGGDVQNPGSPTRESQHSANRRTRNQDQSTYIIQSRPVVNGGVVQTAGSTVRDSEHSANCWTPHPDQHKETIQSMPVVSGGDVQNVGSTIRELEHSANRLTKSENLHSDSCVEAEHGSKMAPQNAKNNRKENKRAKRLQNFAPKSSMVSSASPSETVQGNQNANTRLPQQNSALSSSEIKNKNSNDQMNKKPNRTLPQPNLLSEPSNVSISESEKKNRTIKRNGNVNKTLPLQDAPLKSHKVSQENPNMRLPKQSLLLKSPKASNTIPETKQTVKAKRKAKRTIPLLHIVATSNAFEGDGTVLPHRSSNRNIIDRDSETDSYALDHTLFSEHPHTKGSHSLEKVQIEEDLFKNSYESKHGRLSFDNDSMDIKVYSQKKSEKIRSEDNEEDAIFDEDVLKRIHQGKKRSVSCEINISKVRPENQSFTEVNVLSCSKDSQSKQENDPYNFPSSPIQISRRRGKNTNKSTLFSRISSKQKNIDSCSETNSYALDHLGVPEQSYSKGSLSLEKVPIEKYLFKNSYESKHRRLSSDNDSMDIKVYSQKKSDKIRSEDNVEDSIFDEDVLKIIHQGKKTSVPCEINISKLRPENRSFNEVNVLSCSKDSQGKQENNPYNFSPSPIQISRRRGKNTNEFAQKNIERGSETNLYTLDHLDIEAYSKKKSRKNRYKDNIEDPIFDKEKEFNFGEGKQYSNELKLSSKKGTLMSDKKSDHLMKFSSSLLLNVEGPNQEPLNKHCQKNQERVKQGTKAHLDQDIEISKVLDKKILLKRTNRFCVGSKESYSPRVSPLTKKVRHRGKSLDKDCKNIKINRSENDQDKKIEAGIDADCSNDYHHGALYSNFERAGGNHRSNPCKESKKADLKTNEQRSPPSNGFLNEPPDSSINPAFFNCDGSTCSSSNCEESLTDSVMSPEKDIVSNRKKYGQENVSCSDKGFAKLANKEFAKIKSPAQNKNHSKRIRPSVQTKNCSTQNVKHLSVKTKNCFSASSAVFKTQSEDSPQLKVKNTDNSEKSNLDNLAPAQEVDGYDSESTISNNEEEEILLLVL